MIPGGDIAGVAAILSVSLGVIVKMPVANRTGHINRGASDNLVAMYRPVFCAAFIRAEPSRLKAAIRERLAALRTDSTARFLLYVVGAGGVPVAKHGNRAASSKSGAADVLEALGVKITIPPEKSQELLEKIGICFLFAQNYHIAMKYVAPIRKELGIRTVFNILGPLSNPAGANMQVMGVYDEKLVEPLARVLSNLGVKNAMVVYGQDCLDEISMSARTSVCEIKDGKFRSYEIEPEQFGFKKCDKEELVGGTPEENAKITLSILNGEKGPRREAVLMNAGAAFYVAGKADTLEDAVKLAAEIIDSGKAKARLDEFIKLSNQE